MRLPRPVWRDYMPARATRTMRVLPLLLSQLADVITTKAALAAGATEGNPLMTWAQAHLGEMWWTPKLVTLVTLVSPRAMLAAAMLSGAFACLNLINVAILR